MAIELWSFWNFVSINDVIRICNLTIRFSKFILNIKIYNEFGEKLCSKNKERKKCGPKW